MSANYAVDELLKVLKIWGDKGTLKKGTAVSYKTAIERVFSILDEKEKSDVRNIDVESVIRRFQNLHEADVQPSSVRVYKSRIESAIRSFVAYRDLGPSWKPEVKTRERGKPRNGSRSVTSDAGENNTQGSDISPESLGTKHAETLSLPFPLRSDVTVTVSGLPRDLTTTECFRLGAFLKTLAADFDGK